MSGYKIKLVREIVAEGDKAEKLAPQQKVIYDRLLKIGVNKEVDRDEFVKELTESGELKTRQDVGRVVAYYLQDFTKRGIAESIKPEPAPKAEKEDKPGKATSSKEDKPAKGGSPAEAEAKPGKAA